LNPAIEAEETPTKDAILLKGRGELQLGILVETMRREGFELSLSPPQILTKKNEVSGLMEEPFEEVVVVVPETMAGMVSEKMITRDAELIDMVSKAGALCELKFVIAAKNFLGMREVIRAATKSEATIMNGFKEYRATNGKGRPKIRPGVLVCFDSGLATKYDMEHLVEKGSLFIKERDRVYTGMIVGEHISDNDLDMSVAKGEDRGDVRRKHKEKKYALPPAREMSIEAALAYIADDEMIEVTPARVAMRKVVLDPAERRRIQRKGGAAKTM
jgi:GTP-binding protein